VSPRSNGRRGVGSRPARGGASARRLPKEERLLVRADYRRAAAVGARRTSPHFVVYLARSRSGQRRLGITVSRKVGNAVVRNRIKRLIREYFRISKEHLPPSRDVLVIARKANWAMKLADLARELDHAIGVRSTGR
jgi:ribonuclease P protein component